MKKVLSLFIVCVFLLSTLCINVYAVDQTPSYNVWVAGSCEKVLQDQAAPVNPAGVLEISAAKNEYEGGQVIIRANTTALTNVSITASNLTDTQSNVIGSSNIKIFKQHYMNITEPTTNLPTGWYPDALIPMEAVGNTFDVAIGKNQGVWLTVYIPKPTPAGIYEGTVVISGTGLNTTVPLRVKVYNFELTDTSHSKSSFAVWPGKLKAGHPGVAEGTPEFSQLLQNYYRFFLDYRTTPMDLPIDQNLNPQAYKANAQQFLTDPRITSYRLPFYYNRSVTSGSSSLKAVVRKTKDVPQFDFDVASNTIPANWSQYSNIEFDVYNAETAKTATVNVKVADTNGNSHDAINYQIGSGKSRHISIPLSIFSTNGVNLGSVDRLRIWLNPDNTSSTTIYFDNFIFSYLGTDNLYYTKLINDFETRTDVDPIKNNRNTKLVALSLGTFYPDPNSPDYARTEEVADTLEAAGLLDKSLYYLGEIDEPGPDKYPLVNEYGNALHTIAPAVPNLVTTDYNAGLDSAIDIWCTILTSFSTMTPNDVITIQSSGDHAWWYTCVNPKNPYPSYHIDDYLLGARELSWMQKYYNIEGNLYWAVNIFDKYDLNSGSYIPRNVWTDPKAFPGANGDGYLVYPGATYGINGPIPTIRLEAIRDGAEDYEYLWLLEGRINNVAGSLNITGEFNAKQAMKMYYDRLYSSVRDYTHDPAVFSEVRSDVANDIETVENGLKCLVSVGDTVKVNQNLSTTLNIYAETGSQVTVNNQSVTSQAVVGNADKFVASLNTTAGINSVNITVAKNGATKNITKKFKVTAPPPALVPVTVNTCETQAEIDKFEVTPATQLVKSISNLHATQGSNSLKVVIPGSQDWPNINLRSSNNGIPADWSIYKKYEFDTYNDSAFSQTLYVKYFDAAGTPCDGTVVYTINPGETKHISGLISDITAKVPSFNISNMSIVMIWMYPDSANSRTLYLDNFVLLKEEGT